MAVAASSKALECQACRLPSTTIQTDGGTPVTPTCSCSLKRNPEEREVEDDNDTHMSKKQRTLYPHDALSSSRSPFASIRPPEPSSINNILRKHCRERLYVKPLHWTLQHLDLLGCQFHAKIEQGENAGHAENTQGLQEQSQGQPGDSSSNTTKLPPDTIILRAAGEFFRYTFPSILSKVMRDILEGCGMALDKQQVWCFLAHFIRIRGTLSLRFSAFVTSV